MQLEDYWGVGPKTASLLREKLGEGEAIEAIEAADGHRLVQAGVSRGRATRILRRAHDDNGMDILATRDARQVYRDVIELVEAYAVTERTADRIRVLTPLTTRSAIDDRLDRTMAAVDTWAALPEETREEVLTAFAAYDRQSSRATAVETALALSDLGLTNGVFAPLVDLDRDALVDAAHALRALETEGSGIADGADETLSRLRTDLGTVEDLAADAEGLLDTVETEAHDASMFRDALVRHITNETALDPVSVRDTMPSEATDASMFVTETLRTLAADLRERVDERETTVRADLEATIERVEEDVAAAVSAVDDIALQVSLARFAVAFDLRRPTLVEGPVLAVENARNLDLLAANQTIQPVTYAVGTHNDDIAAPSDDRVTVLTGANSGGKTTLLKTLCQVALLTHMGLPVPAETATVSLTDTLVFHRRHASFNAGVLETTLRSVVPPLTDTGQTLMLVDEFEAITEPGRAADLLHGLVTLTVERQALGVFVTHLAEDLEPLPDSARVDGIFAEGLTDDLNLEVDYQPRFTTLGQSTPEFIVSRLVAQASDARERYGFETLARTIGHEGGQQMLTDRQWTETDTSTSDGR